MPSKRRLLRGSYQNIIDLYEGTPDHIRIEGENWYKDAHVIAQNVGDILLEKAFHITDGIQAQILGAGIVACFSPQMVWEKNIRAANVFARDTNTKPVWITDRDYNKAISMVKYVRENSEADTETVMGILGEGALKTRPFFMNIYQPKGTVKDNGITVDRHAIASYLGVVPNSVQVSRAFSPNGNSQIQNSYKIASDKLGIHHNALQATTWLEWRINKGTINNETV